MAGLLILIILVILCAGAWPAWSYSNSWGYAPSSILGIVLIVVLLLFLLGKL